MELRQMTLSQAAEFDKQNSAKFKLTGWGQICAKRSGPGSESQRRKVNGKRIMREKRETEVNRWK